MRLSKCHLRLHRLAQAYQALVVLISAVVGACAGSVAVGKGASVTPLPLTGAILAWVGGFAGSLKWWALGIPLCQLFCKINGSPDAWKTAQGILDEFWGHIFRSGPASPPDHHRITLFRWVDGIWRWPQRGRWKLWGDERWGWVRGGWLVPVLRSGGKERRSSTVFRAPKKTPDKAQGVAGIVWREERVRVVHELPCLTSSPSGAAVAKYVRHTGVTAEWVRERLKVGRPCARSFCGIPVELGGEVLWVILVDSMNETLPASEDIQAYYRLIGRFLGKIIGGNAHA
jgi:hypothetical protein